MSDLIRDPNYRDVYYETWRPIETAPKDGTWVLCKVEDNDPQYESILVLRYVIGSWGRPGIGGYRATHWMPLPNPPAA